jgi:hypothetical protein
MLVYVAPNLREFGSDPLKFGVHALQQSLRGGFSFWRTH